MKIQRLGFALATSLLLASCAYVPVDPVAQRRVSPDYTASGKLEDVRAYVYAGHTVIEFDRADPAYLLIRDASGSSVNFEKVGRLYRLDRQLDTFTLWHNGASTTFNAVAETRVYSAPTLVTESTEAEPYKVVAAPAAADTDPDVAALLKLFELQLNEVRQAIEAASQNPKSSGAELAAFHARMDEIESRLISAAAAIVRVSFPMASTDFKPTPDVARILITSAHGGQAVKVHGHTDARIAGPAEAKIALGRALAARRFLLNNGIDAKKVSVFSTAAGDFAAPNTARDGRAINRRVEFVFVNTRIAELKSQAVNLAGK